MDANFCETSIEIYYGHGRSMEAPPFRVYFTVVWMRAPRDCRLPESRTLQIFSVISKARLITLRRYELLISFHKGLR